MHKIKNFLKRFLKKDGIIYKVIRKLYHMLSTIKYKVINRKELKNKYKHYTEQVDRAIEKISE